jgi:mono/diheme cytochrome c family protein
LEDFMHRRRPHLVGTAACIVIAPLAFTFSLFDRNKPEVHSDVVEHYKYGSIGAEARTGVPYWIWAVLPSLFPEHLPARPGNGYERFGFVFEPGKQRPIGSSYRERQVPFLGLNCAVCHTGTLREAPGGPRTIILGMPSHQIDLQAYQRFLFRCFADSRFTADRVWPAIQQANPGASWFDGIIYKLFVIPRTKSEGAKLAATFTWSDSRPRQGPGRVDTFNPYKVMFGFDMTSDDTVGTAELPSLWNQRQRDGLWLHWDGNNNKVTERNKSAAIGAGASEESLDLPAMKRVEDWIWDLPAPKFPAERADKVRAAAGQQHYQRLCAACHDFGGAQTGTVVPLADIGTDPERLNSFSPALAEKMNTLGEGREWKFRHFRKTNGYAAMPLDGIWLRAPYLHNGSVPTLRHLLEAEENRPAVFWRSYDVYDYDNAGFVWSGPDAESNGFRFDTSEKGNGRGGHTYGIELSAREKTELLEYLKTL